MADILKSVCTYCARLKGVGIRWDKLVLAYSTLLHNFETDFRICTIRFSDFIVNEVDLCGNVTHLTRTEADGEVGANH